MTDKQALVLLPGQLCDAALWQAQTAGLIDIAEMTVADLTLDDTIGAMAERILAAAPPRFAVGAVSLGGYVAFELYRRAPDRITHLALMNSSARSDTEAQTERRGQVVRAAGMGAFKGVTPRLLPAILHPDHVSDPHMAETVLAMAERVGKVAFERQAAAIIDRPDSRPLLPYISCPTLVVGGMADKMTPPALQEEIAADIPHARLELLEICGHLAPLEQPEAVNRLLRELLQT